MEITPWTPPVIADYVKSEMLMWARMNKETGVTVDLFISLRNTNRP